MTPEITEIKGYDIGMWRKLRYCQKEGLQGSILITEISQRIWCYFIVSFFINEYTLLYSFMVKTFNIKGDILKKKKLAKWNYEKNMDSCNN